MAGSPRIRSLSKAPIFSLTVSILVSVTAMLMISSGLGIQRAREKLEPSTGVFAAGLGRPAVCILEMFDRANRLLQFLGCSCAEIVDKHRGWYGHVRSLEGSEQTPG